MYNETIQPPEANGRIFLLGAEFARGRVCYGPSLSGAEFGQGTRCSGIFEVSPDLMNRLTTSPVFTCKQ